MRVEQILLRPLGLHLLVAFGNFEQSRIHGAGRNRRDLSSGIYQRPRRAGGRGRGFIILRRIVFLFLPAKDSTDSVGERVAAGFFLVVMRGRWWRAGLSGHASAHYG